jgi:hypothetical protein
MPRPALPALGAAAVAAAAGWALTGIPGAPVGCPPPGCDCAAAGAGPILQGANAWSSLALAGAGIWMLSRADGLDRLLGAAVVGSGTAAFLFHASLTGWAARADGIGVAAVAAALAAREWSDRLPPSITIPVSAVAITAAAAAGSPILDGLTAVLGGVAAAGMSRPSRRKGRSGALGRTAAALLAGGAVLWRLGQPGSPWCLPDAAVGPHALWHAAAAGALVAGFAYLRSGPHSPATRLRSSEATQQEPTGCPDVATT